MSRLTRSEIYMVHRIGWLRADFFGEHDRIVYTASLMIGVAAAGTGVLVAGLAEAKQGPNRGPAANASATT